ncbi:MAG TPA: alpha-hydroxy-acid oxidizing protein [Microlunatus sp.]|nr:alpha-hydroxy-acid oxidizing protein [Microlunatus sp.]
MSSRGQFRTVGAPDHRLPGLLPCRRLPPHRPPNPPIRVEDGAVRVASTATGRGLALAGADGVRQVIDDLVAELDLIMALTGVERVADIGRDHPLDVAEH